ncbi:nodal modulator 3 isoform X2 [Orussus abietinus]|uniref:nodal modulator 3 isoform X2 n=1 Tax=Orussus abietinus TaxID=222816 RepID=UPI000625A63C|nr:nodal modulator 3 isoform X2 [Orussus abietinus]
MFLKRGFAAILFINVITLLKISIAEDILGCGGFVKSHTDIDFSKVHVKLYTKSGSLKDQTECAPINGYYFLPLYDKGEYVLKVDPPRGWSFEPTEVLLNVDGSSDLCSQGVDINFTFKGFGITGWVISDGSNSGPQGVTISLYNENNKQTPVGTTITAPGGTFYFTPIQPGKYTLIATHPVWVIEKNKVEVTVKEGNTELPERSLVISGYDVSGKVTSESEPISGVSFILFGNGKAKNCATHPIKGFEDKKPLCHAVSDKNGRFIFPSLSVGEYKIVPYYMGSQTKFVVQPTEATFKIEHDSLILPQDFKVTGFTVSGTVYSMAGGKPLPGAKVYLSGKQIAVTNSEGRYTLDNTKASQYSLRADADDMQFDEKVVKVSPSSPELPPLVPSAYKVCGTVTLSTKGTLHHRKVSIQNTLSTFQTEVDTDPSTGKFCLYLPSGKYQLSIIVTAEEKAKGLQFFPLQQTIDVSAKPINDVNFLQLKATLKGTIQCLKNSDCSHASVTLKILDGITIKTVQTKGGEYQFTEVLPGHYEVLIDTDVFCWEHPSYRVSITSERAEVLPFKQTGFSVTFISSHETSVEFSEPNESKKMVLHLSKGSTRHCVSKAGEYKFVPKSCHIYQQSVYSWDTSSLSPILLSSTKHSHRGNIISNAAVNDIKIKIDATSETPILGPLKYVKDGDNFKYEFEFIASTDTEYIITPLSETLLFNPPSLKVIGTNDCHNNIATFTGDLGKIVQGNISPPLEGVTLRIFGKDKEVPVQTLVTQKDGVYKVGPLDGKVDYSVTAEKDGYVIAGPDDKGIFSAHKLAEIIVDVSDSTDELPLQGVLLSLSGGTSYRKNSVTNEGGQLTFNSLSPGEYYLRPMMKEYRFDPPSKMINVAEGATIKVRLAGNRVAFSAYGSVTSLNGEPEPGVLVEAQGQTNCSSLQEEATTEQNGNFRIRGLQPSCIYAIRLKPNVEANALIQRATPSSIAVQTKEDIQGLRLVVFHPISRTDFSVHVVSPQPEHYRTLKVKLCREDMPDTPIHISKLDGPQTAKVGASYNAGFLVHFPPLQADGKKYFVQLESSLSPALHKYRTTPIYFETNTSFKYVKLTFNAERKMDQSDMNQTSVIALPFIILVAFAFLNRDKVWYWLNASVEKWSKPAPISRAPVQAVPIDPKADDIIVEQIMNINKRKVKPRKA